MRNHDDNLDRRKFLKWIGCASLGSMLPLSGTAAWLGTWENGAEASSAAATASGLGPLNPRFPLGISNVTEPDMVRWARDVALMPVSADLSQLVPVHTQSMVHNTLDTEGPPSAADWCGSPDREIGHSAIVRQVSAHDHTFGRRNISQGNYPLLSYINQHTNQVFYFYNEPETGTHPNKSGIMCDNCYSPPDRYAIDPHAAGCINTFFDTLDKKGLVLSCTNDQPAAVRIRAAALAKLFLYYKSIVEGAGRGHVFLMGSSIYPNYDQSAYWQEFFHFVHNGIGGSCGMPGIPVPELRALHAHYYHWWPSKCPPDNGDQYLGWDAVKPTAGAAGMIRKGVDWYKNTYYGGQALPLDYVLSEMGPNWSSNHSADLAGNAWTGGFPNMMLGLTYWNTWLRWLTRDAWKAGELGLQEGKKVFAMPHETNHHPYFHKHTATSAHNTTAYKSYFNFDTWYSVSSQMPVYKAPNLGYGEYYGDSWTVLPETRRYHEGRYYWFAPFGAAYTVWTHIGGDPGTSTLGAGWRYDHANPGWQGDITIQIPGGGWSTIYVPVAKTTVGNHSEFHYQFEWVRPGTTRVAGDIPLHAGEFPNPKTYSGEIASGYTITPMTAMLCPMLVYSSVARTETLRVHREYAAGQDMGVSIGRPIVLAGVACTWRASRTHKEDYYFESGPQFWCPWA